MKLIYITDTHLGAGTAGFQQQPRQMDRLEEIFQALKRFIRSNDIVLVIHGGDITNDGNNAQIQQAIEQLQTLEVSVAFCLGNHDLAHPDSFQRWQAVSYPKHFSPADAILSLNDEVDLILINNTWWNGAAFGMHWQENGVPYSSISEQTLSWLRQTLESTPNRHPENLLKARVPAGGVNREDAVEERFQRNPKKAAILVVHAPLEAILSRLTGLPEPIHLPTAAYKKNIDELLSRFPRVKLVLTGHNHVNLAVRAQNQFRLSTASLVEPPFEFRLIELSGKSLRVETFPALPTSRHIPYHADKAWVNGQLKDRTLEISWK